MKKFNKFINKLRFYTYLIIGLGMILILGGSLFLRIPISDIIDWQWWLMLFGVSLWSNEGMKQVTLEKKKQEEEEEQEKEKTMEEELKNLANMKINKN